jgi:putative SOS response-associated peptidase YedK
MRKQSHPHKRYSELPPPIATFGQLLRGSEKWLWVHCNNWRCHHRVALPLAPFAIRWGLDAEVTTTIRKAFRCSHCGDMTSTLSAPSVSLSSGGVQPFPRELGLRVVPDHAWLDAMCNLYSLNSTREEIGRLFKVTDNRMSVFSPQLTLFPARLAPVVRRAGDGERELVVMSWGFVLLQPGKAPRRVTNTRDDKVHSAFWRKSIEQRRCLVPVTSFAEPDQEKPVNWHWFALKGNSPRPLFAFAGVWQSWTGPIKKDGPPVEIETYSFFTTKPNTLTSRINHERMPVLLATETSQNVWLNGSTPEALCLIQFYPAEDMAKVQAGLDKEDLERQGTPS